jgi:hypothetical protein
MKILSGLLFFILLGVNAYAQHAPSASGAKVIAEIAARSEKVVKGSPFSAEAVSESVQVLSDGNRIVRSTTSKLYRNSEGRFRRELSGGSGDAFGSAFTIGQGITIVDPVIGHRVLLDSEMKTARITELHNKAVTVLGSAKPAHAPQAVIAELEAAKQRSVTRVLLPNGQYEKEALTYATKVEGGGTGFAYTMGPKSKYETRTEQLGTQNIEGVNAEGTRTVTTIPAGAIGNERPIEMVYEKWYSPELDLVVMSKSSDPRFGEQTYRLTNIVRSEPDPSLFSLPSGYKVLQPGSVYRMNTPKIEAEKAASATRAAGRP